MILGTMDVTLETSIFFLVPMWGLCMTVLLVLGYFCEEKKNIKIYCIRLEALEGHSLIQLCIFPILNARLFFKNTPHVSSECLLKWMEIQDRQPVLIFLLLNALSFKPTVGDQVLCLSSWLELSEDAFVAIWGCICSSLKIHSECKLPDFELVTEMLKETL